MAEGESWQWASIRRQETGPMLGRALRMSRAVRLSDGWVEDAEEKREGMGGS